MCSPTIVSIPLRAARSICVATIPYDKDTNKRGQKQTCLHFAEREYLRRSQSSNKRGQRQTYLGIAEREYLFVSLRTTCLDTRIVILRRPQADVRISFATEIATPRCARLAMTGCNTPLCHSEERVSATWESLSTQNNGNSRPQMRFSRRNCVAPQNDTSTMSFRAERSEAWESHSTRNGGDNCPQMRFSRRNCDAPQNDMSERTIFSRHVHRTLLRMADNSTVAARNDITVEKSEADDVFF